MQLTQQQKDFFEAFGFLQFPGALGDDIGWIIEEFEAVFVDHGMAHNPAQRTCLVPFIDQRERLCSLLDHPVVHRIACGLLGDDFNYTGSDGTYTRPAYLPI